MNSLYMAAEPAQNSSRKHNRLTFWLTLVAIVLYALVIEWAWGWPTIFAQWQDWSWQAFLFALTGMFVTYALRAYRICDYFRYQRRGAFLISLRVTLLHNLANNLLPMRSGEASFPLLIRSEFGVSATAASGTLILFRLLDLHALGIIGLSGFLAYMGGHGAYWLLIFLISMAPLVVVPMQARLSFWLNPDPKAEAKGKLRILGAKLLLGLPSKQTDLLRTMLITWLNWLLKIAIFAWILLAFAPMNWLQGLTGALGGELSSILPFHAPGGIGTYEAGVVAGALLAGADAGESLGAAVSLHLILIISTLLGGILASILGHSNKKG